jgi:hypothetical protein
MLTVSELLMHFLATIWVYTDRPKPLLWYDTDNIKKTLPSTFLVLLHVFITMVTYLPSHCLASIGRIHMHAHTDWWQGLKQHTVQMGSGAMIYMQSFRKIGSDIQKLSGGDTLIYWQQGDPIILLLSFFKIRKVG